jgi:hypothetical protein
LSGLTLPLAIIACASPPSSPNGSNVLIEINIAEPQQYWLAAATTTLLAPEAANGLAQLAPDNIGWFDYSFLVKQQGWYRLLVDASPHISKTEFIFDLGSAEPEISLADGASIGLGRFEMGWVWLQPGSHRLRIQHLFWTGFPHITQVRLEGASENALPFRIDSMETTTFRLGRCSQLTIETGGNITPFTIEAVFRSGGKLLDRQQILISPSQILVQHSIDLPCNTAGDISLDLRSIGQPDALQTTAHLYYAVFDTSPVEPVFRRGRLAIDIDAVDRQPDYESGNTSIESGPPGTYRTSGSHGSTPFVRRMARIGVSTAADWFAYRVEGLLPDRPYILEVEYPDDSPRVFVVALRDSSGLGYPTSIGAETGVVWRLSGSMATTEAVTWPSSSEARVIIFNIHDGMKAAVSHIRLYEAISSNISRANPPDRGRDTTFWYEEGDNFRDLVGAGRGSTSEFTPIDRYLRLARWTGATIVSPTVAIYNFAMYPSRFHLTFSDGNRDMTAAFMLGAERYGLKIVPQLHPRADELLWSPRDRTSLGKRLLLSSNGQQHLLRWDNDFYRPPFFNPLNPDVRNWYVEMVGELADRYKSFPAFAGIDLRVSDWQNAALNNLVSLDWGYDAASVARFFQETGLTPPPGIDISTDAPAFARQRHDFLVSERRADWIAWRCEKIRDLYRDIVQRIRTARSDLRLSISIFGERTWTLEVMREFGIDINLLNALDGVTVVDVRFGHGARETDPLWRRIQYDDFSSATSFESIAKQGSRPHVILPMEYIEITGQVAPSEMIGLLKPSREPRISSASEPPGRLSLARYATVLGLTDAFMLGDGGNGYVFGGDALREFLKEFRTLPQRSFHRVQDSPDTIIVRQSERIFYVVNMLDVRVSANIQIDAPPGSVKRMTTGQVLVTDHNMLQVELLPYELMVFDMDVEHRIIGAKASLDRLAEANIRALAAAATRHAAQQCGRLFAGKKCTEAQSKSRKIEAAMAQDNFWTAKRLLEAQASD